ncbi:MAG: HAMP domain-containing histidine kinase [Candidatus Wallbacteria bacterium]|nr:HAMP domain-containing histidine kinase [Candidatus Wallbacteria bacterium]
MIRSLSLSWKLSGLILLTLVCGVGLQWGLLRLSHPWEQPEGPRAWNSMQGELAALILDGRLKAGAPDSALQETVRSSFERAPHCCIILFDDSGRIRASLRRPSIVELTPEILREAAMGLHQGKDVVLQASPGKLPVAFIRASAGRPALYAACIPARGPDRPVPPSRLYFLLVPIVTFLLVSGIAGVLGLRLFLRRIRGLEEGVALLSKGELAARIDPGPDDEIGRLGRAFNAMADNLCKAVTELEAQDRIRREILADVAHELRTPLTSLTIQVDLFRQRPEEVTEEQAEQIEIIADNAATMGRRIRDILVLSRSEAGEIVLKIGDADLVDLLRDLVRDFTPVADKRSVRLLAPPEEGPLVIPMDKERLRHVFENLLQNAIQYSQGGGRVAIGLRVEGIDVVVEFEDSGPGIAPEDLSNIFERFRRGHGSLGAGTGLGLAIVKKFVELHGGRCSATSILGKGSRFTVRLPIMRRKR